MTYDEFAEAHGITMTCKSLPTRPGAEEWPRGSTHWKCTLRKQRRSMAVTYSMGPAHTHTPTVGELLNSVALDASTGEAAGDYEDFLSDFGYEDEPQHRRTWKAIEKQTAALKRLLDDDDLYEELLYETEEE